MEVITNVSGAPKPVGPYSPAIRAGGLLFLAGQVGIDPETGSLVGGGLEAQLRQVLKNLGAVLAHCGSGPEKIVMTTIFLTNISDSRIVNEVYGEFVNREAPPARQTVAVKELPLGALIEISVIAE